MENKKTENLVPPLTFRLYQTIKFNRPIDKDKDYISPGGYELRMKDESGEEKIVQFDFEEFTGNISDNDPCALEVMQKNPDYHTFEDLNKVTEYMLRNVTSVIEWYIYTGEPDENEGNPLIPVTVADVTFEIISDSTDRDIPVIQIPMTTPIPLPE